MVIIDIGNSTTVFASVNDGKYEAIQTISTAEFLEKCDFLFGSEPLVISSVVPEIDQALAHKENYTFITYKNIPKLTINMKAPEEVGADRLVNALAAAEHYGAPVIVIDAGTAITFCYVDEHWSYEGGVIFPGMRISSQALNDYTAKIPLIYVDKEEGLLGKDTESAVKKGLYFGYIDMLNGYIARLKKQYPKAKVVGTGPSLAVLKDELDLDVFDDELILKGLLSCL